ncbi:MAG: HypC/HybG/HupF family hydrogenase formation chaperone [Candidatus Dormiibacterota bacterium]
MSAECHDEVCITCSDQLLSVVVTEVDTAAGIARCTIDDAEVEIGIDLLGGVAVGDVLLCHGGVALQRAAAVEVGS